MKKIIVITILVLIFSTNIYAADTTVYVSAKNGDDAVVDPANHPDSAFGTILAAYNWLLANCSSTGQDTIYIYEGVYSPASTVIYAYERDRLTFVGVNPDLVVIDGTDADIFGEWVYQVNPVYFYNVTFQNFSTYVLRGRSSGANESGQMKINNCYFKNNNISLNLEGNESTQTPAYIYTPDITNSLFVNSPINLEHRFNYDDKHGLNYNEKNFDKNTFVGEVFINLTPSDILKTTYDVILKNSIFQYDTNVNIFYDNQYVFQNCCFSDTAIVEQSKTDSYDYCQFIRDPFIDSGENNYCLSSSSPLIKKSRSGLNSIGKYEAGIVNDLDTWYIYDNNANETVVLEASNIIYKDSDGLKFYDTAAVLSANIYTEIFDFGTKQGSYWISFPVNFNADYNSDIGARGLIGEDTASANSYIILYGSNTFTDLDLSDLSNATVDTDYIPGSSMENSEVKNLRYIRAKIKCRIDG